MNWRLFARKAVGVTLFASPQRTHAAIITSLLRENDVATSFSHNNDVIIAACVRWDAAAHKGVL